MLPLVAILVLGVFAKQTFADEPEAIIGGSAAGPGEFPYQVSLRQDGAHFCGGTIVNSKTIITAAHCVKGIARSPDCSDITVYTSTLSSRTGISHKVQSCKIHPQYGGQSWNSWVNDIAVIILKTPMLFNNYQRPLPLATKEPSPGTPCVVSGWGKTSMTSSVSPDLRKANVNVVDHATCQKAHSNQPLYNSHLCTFARYGIGACSGDSGGPLYCNGQLAGVVSWVRLCAVGVPDVFCKVSDPGVRNFLSQFI